MPSIDLNSDLGEGYGIWKLGNDDELLDVITSANVACGFHGGDPNIMRHVCRRAAEGGVAIGAQVSYQDRAGFGRRYIDVEANDLTNDVLYQIGALRIFAEAAGTGVSYVKPHGALYHAVTDQIEQAAAVVEGVRLADPYLAVLCMSGSAFESAAREAGLRTVTEGYADRAYEDNGRLRSRRLEGAVLASPHAVVAQALSIASKGSVTTHTGQTIPINAQSLCVHGDTPGAVDLARAIRRSLEDTGARIESFREEDG